MTRRIRLGVFVNDLLSPYQIRLFNSLKRAADARGVRIIGFQGSFLVSPEQERRTAFDGSFVYGLAGEESVDGLIIAANVLSSRVGSEVVHDLCKKTRLPIVSVGRVVGVPSIEVGARDALRAVVEHLVRVHSRRKIAFIQGAAGNPDSIERERVVRTVLKELDVPLLDELVLPGDFLEASGAMAIRLLFDRRGASSDSIDAVIASNDQMAAGAMHELTQRGLGVPNDVSVVGFDDDEFARSANPPLTTVSQPIESIGERALTTILSRIRGETVADRVILDAEPVWRRSCGCAILGVPREPSSATAQPLHIALNRCRDSCVERFEKLAGKHGDSQAVNAAIRLLNSEDDTSAGLLLHDVERHILLASNAGIDPLHWHDLLLPLSEEIERRATLESTAGRRMAQHMRRVNLLINEVAARVRALGQLHTMQWANAARVLASALSSLRHLRSLSSVLQAGLPSLGIRYCCVCLFVGEVQPRIARVAALYNPTVPPPADSPRSAEQLWLAIPGSLPPDSSQPGQAGSLFPAYELVHPKLQKSSADALDLSVYPLVYGLATLGYVVFDAPGDGQRSWLLEGLAGSLSTAIYAIERNAELYRAKEIAERASAAKTEFVAMISHEVRTPLTAIMGHIDLCLQARRLTDQDHHLKQARNSSKALLGIVNDVLDFSRIEAQKIQLEEVPFAVDDVLDQVIATCAATANNKGLQLIVDVGVEVPRWIRGDPLRVTQVLLNLVGNAVKFSAHGDVVVAVTRAEPCDSESVTLSIAVEDQGIGMHPQEIARVFDPFTQADGSMTRRFGGTGLGLTISRRLITLMGGDLTVTSQPGQGCRFVFKARFKPHDMNAMQQPIGIGKSVLVVASHGRLSQSIERLLKSHGFQVTCVSNAESALENLAHSQGYTPGFDLLICDYDLPDLNAFYLLRRAATDCNLAGPSAILLCTPDVDSSSMGQSDVPNLAAIVEKPYQRIHLLQAITTALSVGSSQAPASGAGLSNVGTLPPGARILLVQDDATSCDVVREILTRAGAAVSVATTGEEGISLAEHEPFELILQDLHLPGIDGFDTARAIRKLPDGANVPIIALSASPMQNSLQRCLAAGINDFLVAPVEPRTLLRTARLWIGGEASAPPMSQRFNCVTYTGMAQQVSRAATTPELGAELQVDQALSRLGGDRAIYLKLLGRFSQSHARTASLVRRATEQGNLESAILAVHTLASAAANIGATWLHETARLVEVTLRDCDTSNLAELLVDFEMAESRTIRAIEVVLSAQVTGDYPTLEPKGGNIDEVLNHLRVMIDEHDTAVFDQLLGLKNILGDKRSASDAFHKLEASIGVYDFDQAREHFDAVADWIANSERLFPSMD